jgi:hypothetical protein
VVTRKAKLIIAAFAIIVAISIIFFGLSVIARNNFENRFAEVKAGHSEQEVVTSLGRPSVVESCNGPSYSDGRFVGNCFKNLRYAGLFEVWGVMLDNKGKVLLTYHSVSP